MAHEGLESALRASFGVAPHRPWLEACVSHLGSTVSGFNSMDIGSRARLVLEQLLCADLRDAGAGGLLPDGVAALHREPLPGRFLLQVDEVVNVAAAWRDRCVAGLWGGWAGGVAAQGLG
jgi:hypothetical protein